MVAVVHVAAAAAREAPLPPEQVLLSVVVEVVPRLTLPEPEALEDSWCGCIQLLAPTAHQAGNY